SRLRAGVLAEPDADAPRLEYAAWCDGQRDPRGEFIRLQIEGDDREHEAKLLAEHGSRWQAELEPWAARDVIFRRGFAEATSLAGRAFISLGDGLLRTAPVSEVRLVAVQPLLGELASCPHLAKLRRLDLTGNQVGSPGLRTLGGSEFRTNLEGLDL